MFRKLTRVPFIQPAAAVVIAVLAAVWLVSSPAMAHCDAEDGPVAKDVQRALAESNVQPILKWVTAEDEAELKAVFEQTMRVRKLGDDALQLADRFLLETAVRLHRMSEGAPYTGIKPAGQPLPPAVNGVDEALESNDVESLIADLQQEVDKQVRSRFDDAARVRDQADDSPEIGRRYVHAYVELVHYVLNLHNALEQAGHPAELEHGDGHLHAAACCEGSIHQ